MAQPQPRYPAQGYPNHDQYTQQPGEQYENGAQPVYEGDAPPTQGEVPAPSGAGRRKRQYAGQAYDFGQGGNASSGGQQHSVGSFSDAPGAGYGGYGTQAQQPGLQQPAYGVDNYGIPAPVLPASYGQAPPAVGGYQPPDPAYPAHGATSVLGGGVGGITQGMNNIGIGGQASLTPQPMPQRPHLNQLYPTDLLNQPFMVSELDIPPPAIVLPANVSNLVQDRA